MWKMASHAGPFLFPGMKRSRMSTEGTCVPVNSILKEQVTQFLGRAAISPTGVSWFVSVGTPDP